MLESIGRHRTYGKLYLANALWFGVLGNGMIVEFLGLITELGYLAADESKETFVDGLYISFITQRFRYTRICLEVRRVEFGIQLMQDVAKSYSIRQPLEGLGIAV